MSGLNLYELNEEYKFKNAKKNLRYPSPIDLRSNQRIVESPIVNNMETETHEFEDSTKTLGVAAAEISKEFLFDENSFVTSLKNDEMDLKEIITEEGIDEQNGRKSIIRAQVSQQDDIADIDDEKIYQKINTAEVINEDNKTNQLLRCNTMCNRRCLFISSYNQHCAATMIQFVFVIFYEALVLVKFEKHNSLTFRIMFFFCPFSEFRTYSY